MGGVDYLNIKFLPLRDQIIMEDMQKIKAAGEDWNWLRNSGVLVTGAYGMLASYMIFFLIYLNELDPSVVQGR